MKGYVVRGGVVTLANIPEPKLLENTVIIKNTVLGLNKLDGDCISKPDFETKYGLGFEGVGVIKAFHQSCTRKWVEGQRVCYSTCYGVGSFADETQIHEDFLIIVPDDISNEQAATIFKGLTAHMLLFRSYMLRKNDTIGLTSPTSGVGAYVSQWASNSGVKGVGLMLGIEFSNFKGTSSVTLQMLSNQHYLGYVIAGYLLNEYDESFIL
jgi:NADPH:quinone reductase-like Zn-dependent oxidoreductase